MTSDTSSNRSVCNGSDTTQLSAFLFTPLSQVTFHSMGSHKPSTPTGYLLAPAARMTSKTRLRSQLYALAISCIVVVGVVYVAAQVALHG